MSFGMFIILVFAFFIFLLMEHPVILFLVVLPLTIVLIINFITWLKK